MFTHINTKFRTNAADTIVLKMRSPFCNNNVSFNKQLQSAIFGEVQGLQYGTFATINLREPFEHFMYKLCFLNRIAISTRTNRILLE